MSLAIRWTIEAEYSFDQIVNYLENKWSERQVQKFIKIIDKTLKQIAEFPHMFERSSSNPNIRKGYIAKQCSLFYEIRNEVIVLLYFWDNRRKPISKAI